MKRIAHRWRPATLVFCICFLLVAALALLLPDKYASHLKVVVKNERVDPLIGADKQTQGVLYVNEISEARINTEIQLMLSEDVLREVVARCHLANFAGTPRQPQTKREQLALDHLKRDLVVNAVRNSNVVEASYESKDARRSKDVLDSLAQAYMRSHRSVHGVPGSYEFFKQVSARYDTELAAAESDLASFRSTHHIVTMDEQKTLALANISHLQSQMEESAAAAAKQMQTAAQLRKQMAGLPETVERGRRSIPNQTSIEQLSTLNVSLQNKRTQAAFRYQPEDRIVRELDVQIAQTQDAIASARQSSSEEVSTAANPALDFARAEYVRADAEQAGDRARASEIDRQFQQDRGELMRLDAQSVTYRNLMRRVSNLEDLDQANRKRTDEARLAEMLDEQRISNLAFIEEPALSELPSSPRRGLIFAVGVLWSLLFAGATAIGLELLTERIHTPFALEHATGVPVLATVPANALPPSYGGAFPALYLAMQRPAILVEGGRS